MKDIWNTVVTAGVSQQRTLGKVPTSTESRIPRRCPTPALLWGTCSSFAPRYISCSRVVCCHWSQEAATGWGHARGQRHSSTQTSTLFPDLATLF